MTDLPELLRNWKTPWYVTADGVKDANGCWIMSASNTKLAHQIVEMANFAGVIAAKPASTVETVKVKPLVWKDGPAVIEEDGPIYSEAVGAGYTYVAEAIDMTLDEVKSSKQAEFESRVRAAIYA